MGDMLVEKLVKKYQRALFEGGEVIQNFSDFGSVPFGVSKWVRTQNVDFFVQNVDHLGSEEAELGLHLGHAFLEIYMKWEGEYEKGRGILILLGGSGADGAFYFVDTLV